MTLAGVLVILAAALLALGAVRATLFSSHEVRRTRWRVMARMRAGGAYATWAELALHWSRLSARHHGSRARPSMGWWRRLFSPATEYAVRLGRGPGGRVCWARHEDQELIVAPPRSFKTGHLADMVIGWPGAAVIAESRPDIWGLTAGYRDRLGPLDVFNPEKVDGIPSTFRWAITQGCHDEGEAVRRATDLVGAVAEGEMQWWVEKSATVLAAAMHAAGLLGDDMTSVWAWSNNANRSLPARAAQVHGASPELFGALAELDRPSKTADSIRLTMSKAIAWMGIPAIRHMVCAPAAGPFDVAAFTRNRGTVYMLAPGGEDAPAAPLFRCFGSYVHRAAKMEAQTRRPRVLDPRLLFAIDELHLMPVNLPAWMADSAGFGVHVAAVIHGTGQLEQKYGRPGAQAVWAAAGTKLFLPGIHDAASLADVATIYGPVRGHGDHPYVDTELIARLPDPWAFVLRRNWSPNIVKTRPAWRRIPHRLGLAPQPPQLQAAPEPPKAARLILPATATGAPITAFETEAAEELAAANGHGGNGAGPARDTTAAP